MTSDKKTNKNVSLKEELEGQGDAKSPAYGWNDFDPVHTACADCVFAEKITSPHDTSPALSKRTQTGCSFNRLEKYRDKGAQIIDAYDENGDEFSVINGKICLYKRTKDWGELTSKKRWRARVNDELRMKYHAMVSFGPEDSLQDLHKTMQSLNDQSNPPTLTSVLSTSKEVPTHIINALNSANYENLDWRLQTFIDEEIHERQCIDLAIDNTKKLVRIVFYMLFQAGFEVPNEMSDEIHQYFIEDMGRVIFASGNDDGNGMLVSFPFHIKHAGNAFHVRIEDKLREFEEGAEQYFRKIEDVCPSLKM
jgi:hypothetical protein